VNSAASLAAGLPVGRRSVRGLVLAAYALPGVAAWALVGACLVALPLTGAGLIGAAAYGGYYGLAEVTGRGGLPVPGRRWQVPQTMMIDASPRRRVLVWGAILGPGFLTRNPFPGFGLLLFVVAAMRLGGFGPGLALAAAIGLAHGTARGAALLRDIGGQPVATGPGSQLDLLLKAVYWRRWDGAALLAVAATAAALAVRYF
jgi:hypothetical protein